MSIWDQTRDLLKNLQGKATNVVQQVQTLPQQVQATGQLIQKNYTNKPFVGGYVGDVIKNLQTPKYTQPQYQAGILPPMTPQFQQQVNQFTAPVRNAISQAGQRISQLPTPQLNKLPGGFSPFLPGIPNIPQAPTIDLPVFGKFNTNPAQIATNLTMDTIKSGGKTIQRLGEGKFGQGGIANAVEDYGNLVSVLPMGRIASYTGKVLPKVLQGRVAAVVQGLDNFDSFSPQAQIQIYANLEKVAKEAVPEVINSKSMKKLAVSNPLEWRNTLHSLLAARLEQSLNPTIPVGMSVKYVGKPKTTKTQALQQGLQEPLSPSEVGGSGRISSKGIISQENPTDPFYNIQRIGSTPQGKKVIEEGIEQIKPRIEATVGKKLSHQEIIQQAQYTSDELIRTIGRQRTAELGAAQLRLRENIAKMADEGQITKELLESINADKAFAANEARLLGQRAITAQPTTPQGKLMSEYIQNILKVNDDLDAILAKAKGVDWNDPKSTTAFYREFIKPTAGDWIDKLRYNSMLSSPSTHIVNIAGNWQGTGVLTPIQKTIEGPVDLIHSMITGQKRTRFTGEGLEYAKGYYTAGKEAWNNLLDVLKGKSNLVNLDNRNIPLSTGKISGGIEKVLDTPQKALNGMDIFFRTLTQRGLEKSYAYKLAKGGKNLSGQATQEAEKLLFRGEMVEKGEGIISNTLGAGANWIMNARNSEIAPWRWLAKMTFPFVATGTNLAKTGLEANPLMGPLNLIGNTDKTAAVAKMIMGGAVTLVGASLALSDRLTGYSPASATRRVEEEQAGRQPWSMKVGDKWVSYSKMHPLIAFQLGMVGSLMQGLKDKKIEENTAEAVANGLAKSLLFFADQTYFKNLTDFTNVVRGDELSFKRLASNYPSQFIPFKSAMGYINRIIEQYQRKPDTDAGFITQVLQQMTKDIPGVSRFTPYKEGMNGQPQEVKDRGINAISPFRVSTINPQGEADYQTGLEISKIKQESTYTSKQKTKDAEQLYNELKSLPKEEANLRAKQLKQTDPVLYDKLKSIVEDNKLGLSSVEKNIKSLPVTDGSRAKYILKELNKLQTREEKNAMVKDWKEKKIITDEVYKQLKSLLQK